MGRLFVIEFNNYDMNKFYVCRFCGTPFARNNAVESYLALPSNPEEGAIVRVSYLRTISNVEFFDYKQSFVVGGTRCTGQHICCVVCNYRVGVKRTNYRNNLLEALSHSLYSERTLFRINGQNRCHSTISHEEWFDPPRPRLMNSL